MRAVNLGTFQTDHQQQNRRGSDIERIHRRLGAARYGRRTVIQPLVSLRPAPSSRYNTITFRENVYDTAAGKYLLIPQGARLVGTYDSHNMEAPQPTAITRHFHSEKKPSLHR